MSLLQIITDFLNSIDPSGALATLVDVALNFVELVLSPLYALALILGPPFLFFY